MFQKQLEWRSFIQFIWGNMASEDGFRARLRFRIAKRFLTEETERSVKVGNQIFKIAASQVGQPLGKSDWLIADGMNFPSELSAREAGERLRLALLITSMCRRVGIDTGPDLPTYSPGAESVRAEFEKTGLLLRADIHGLDVFPQNPPSTARFFEVRGLIPTPPDVFFNLLGKVVDAIPNQLPRSAPAIVLINGALSNPEPPARLVLSISAVEMLAQGETWSKEQIQVLQELAEIAESKSLPPGQSREVSEMIRNSFRISLRQSVFRLLNRVGLDDLRKSWDAIYNYRSGIFHGTMRVTDGEYHKIANDAVSLCSKIVLAFAQTEGLPREVALHPH